MSNEWVEVEAKSIDDAIKVGLKELNLESSTEAEIKILREPEGGVFGVGGTKALVRISVRSGDGRGYKDRKSNRSNYKQREKTKPNFERKQRTYKENQKREYKEANPEEQLKIAIEFLGGLLNEFGLEGKVEGSVDDRNLIVEVKGEQTEALVGEKGFIIRSIHELTRTVI